MRLSAVLLLALAACTELVPDQTPPDDRFYYPVAMAATPGPGGRDALLVVSSNFDLRYGAKDGGTLISVAPASSLVPGGNTLVPLGTPAHLGSYAGQLAVADARTCPGLGLPAPLPAGWAGMALTSSRLTRELYAVGIAGGNQAGGLADCGGPGACGWTLDAGPDFADPYSMAVACRSDGTAGGTRSSAFVGYLRTHAWAGAPALYGWITEVDLNDLGGARRTIPVALGPIGALAYDSVNDRLYTGGRAAGFIAPITALDLCAGSPAAVNATSICAAPTTAAYLDLFPLVYGAEIEMMAFSNLQPAATCAAVPAPDACRRRLYVGVRIYDVQVALSIGGRPSYDVGSALVILDATDGPRGHPTLQPLGVIPLLGGTGTLAVLPRRPPHADGTPRRDLVALASVGGEVMVYDDEAGALVSVQATDPATGISTMGRAPFALAVEDRKAIDSSALVYVATFDSSQVSAIQVPLAPADDVPAGTPAPPGGVQLLTGANAVPLRIGMAR